MGGLDSEITESTTDILLEGANFSGPSIMRTESALGLRSEASTRYEKGLDPEMIPLGSGHGLQPVRGTVRRDGLGGHDRRAHRTRAPQTLLKLRPARVEHVLGARCRLLRSADILRRLGCEVTEGGEDLTVAVPSFRADLEREIDLIEEVARIHGLDQIPSTLPARRSGHGGLQPAQAALRRVEDLLVGAGLSQVITYSFGDEKWPDRLRLAADDRRREGVRSPTRLAATSRSCGPCCFPVCWRRRSATWRYARSGWPSSRWAGSSGPPDAELPDEMTHVGLLVTGRVGGAFLAAVGRDGRLLPRQGSAGEAVCGARQRA